MGIETFSRQRVFYTKLQIKLRGKVGKVIPTSLVGLQHDELAVWYHLVEELYYSAHSKCWRDAWNPDPSYRNLA